MTVSISPTPKLQFFDSNGLPLSGGLLYTYASGTTTPLDTYTSSTGLAANANPVVLDSRGEASVWLGTAPYRFTLKTSTGVLISTTDGVTSPSTSSFAGLSATYTLTSAGTITPNLASGYNFRLVLATNTTLANPTAGSAVDGQVYNFYIKQDGTGSRTMAFGTKYTFPGGTDPILSTAANAVDFMSCFYDLTSDTYVCVMNKAFA